MKRMQRVFGDLDALRFVDNRLDAERRAAFLAHLAEDPHEAERVATWARQNDVLRAAFAGIGAEPVPLWLRLSHIAADRSAPREIAPAPEQRRVRESDAKVAELRRGPRVAPIVPPIEARPPRHRSTSIGLSAAALLAIGVLVLLAAHTLLPTPIASEESGKLDPSGMGLLLSRASDAFRTYALDPARPVEIPASQQVALDRWLQRRLGLPVQAADLKPDGWTLLGGRLVPGEVGPSAFYVYENEAGDRMGLYVARNTSAPSTTLALDPLLGSGAAMSWVSEQTGYVITVDKPLDWLSRNAETLRARVMRTAG